MYETHPVWVPDGLIASLDVFKNVNTIKQQATELFSRYDKDNDGKLKSKEFKEALSTVGIRKKQAKVIRKLWDIEDTGRIDKDAFVNVYCFVRSGQLYTRKLDKFEELENEEPPVKQ